MTKQEAQHALLYSGKGRELLLSKRIIDFKRVCRDQGGEIELKSQKELGQGWMECFKTFGGWGGVDLQSVSDFDNGEKDILEVDVLQSHLFFV